MKEKILEYVRQYPGARKCEIASALNVWVCDKNLTHAINELVGTGELVCVVYSDPANMKWHYEFYLKNF